MLGLLSGCAKEGKISLGEQVVSQTQGNQGQFSIETVAVNNNRLILQGKNLQSISSLKVTGPSLNRNLTIESKSASQIVVFFSTLPSPQFVADLVYDLVISSASAQSVVPITFTVANNGITTAKIANGAVTLSKLNGSGAGAGQVIKWNGSNFIFADDLVGSSAGSGSGITMLTLGTGMVGAGGNITNTGTVAVNLGYGANQIPFFDAGRSINMPHQNSLNFLYDDTNVSAHGGLSFAHTSDGTNIDREFVLLNDGDFILHDVTDGFDRLIVQSDGDVIIKRDLNVEGALTVGTKDVCLEDGTNCPASSSGPDTSLSGSGGGPSNVVYAANSGNVGILTTAPTMTLGLNGNAARTIGLERHSTADTAGSNFTLSAGGATLGSLDRSGGNLLLQSGTSTGSANSSILFQTSTSGASGTSDRAATTKMILNGAGRLGVGTVTPGGKVHIVAEGITSGTSSLLIQDALLGPLFQVRDDGRVMAPQYCDESGANCVDASTGLWDNLGNHTATQDLSMAGFNLESNTGLRIDIDNNNDATTEALTITKDNGATELLRVREDGNVGIGTANPASQLDIVGPFGTQIRLSDNQTNNSPKVGTINVGHYSNAEESQAMITMNSTGAGTSLIEIGGGLTFFNGATEINFYTAANNTTLNGTRRMSINNSGFVKIGGTTTASNTLHVEGTMRFQDGNQAAGKVLTSDANGVATWQTPGTGADNLGNHTATQLLNMNGQWINGGTTASEGIYIDTAGKVGIGTSTVPAKLNITTGGTPAVSGLVLKSDASQTASLMEIQTPGGTVLSSFDSVGRLRVNSPGTGAEAFAAIGGGSTIGNTSLAVVPGHVGWNAQIIRGLAGQTADLLQWQNSGGTVLGKIDANGFIGVGTVAPIAELHLHSNADGISYTHYTSSTTGSLSSDGMTVGYNSGGVIQVRESAPLTFSTNDTARMWIDATGRVKVGAGIAPTTTLHVQGDVRIVDGNQAAGKVLTSDANGVATWQTPGTGADNLGNHTAAQLLNMNGFWINGDTTASEGLFINTSGSLGIGTSTVNAKLDVAGNIQAQASFSAYTGDGLFGSDATPIKINLPNGHLIRMGYVSNGDGNYAGAIGFADSGLTKKSWLGAGGNGDYDHLVFGNTAERMRIDSSGNVGIGVGIPTSKLHVVGNIRMVDGNQAAGRVLTSDANGVATWQAPGSGADNLGNHTAAQLLNMNGFWINGDSTANEGIYIAPSGFVGIGTNNPIHTLSVYGDIGLPSNDPAIVMSATTTVGLRFFKGPSEKMVLDEHGDLGINIIDPVALLHVHEDRTNYTGVLIDTAGGTSDLEIRDRIVTNRKIAMGHTGNELNIRGENAGTSGFRIVGASSNLILAANTTNNIQLETNGIQRMIVANNGAVGIGHSAPTYKLSIHDAGATIAGMNITNSTTGSGASDGFSLQTNNSNIEHVLRENGSQYFYTNNVLQMTLDAEGDLGLGTASPASKLSIDQGNATNRPAVTISNMGPGTTGLLMQIAAGGEFEIGHRFGNVMQVASSNRTINYTVNGGAYDTSPVAHNFTMDTYALGRHVLSVTGPAEHTGSLQVWRNSTPTELARVTAAGSFWMPEICDEAGNNCVDISGGWPSGSGSGSNIPAVVKTADYSIYVGDYAGVAHVDGLTVQNTSIGASSLYNNDSGTYNVAVGYGSLNLNTSGNYNTAVGAEALLYNGSGMQNVAVGFRALHQNGASDNVAVGVNSLVLTSTGESNAALGNHSLSGNVSGSYNAAFGPFAMYYSVSGNSNVAMGNRPLYNNYTGDANIAIGYVSLWNNTTGSDNIGLGSLAGYSNQGGNHQISIGTAAGFSFNDGSAAQNISIGTYANYGNTIGGGNVSIGTSAAYNYTGSDIVALGRAAAFNNTSGGENMALGPEALYTNSTGSGNLGIGPSAGRQIASSHNIAIGGWALYSGGGGSGENMAIGYASLSANTTGEANVGVGFRAINENVGGSYNTAVGAASMLRWQGTQNTALGAYALGDFSGSGDGNIVIGYQAGSSMGDISNRLVIENSNSATPLIYGEFDNDLVRINGSLEVSQRVKIRIATASEYCDSNNEGLLLFDGATGGLIVCDGSEWKAIAVSTASGCASWYWGQQGFSSDMYGCYGSETFANRANLCASGWHVCSVSEYRNRRGSVVPGFHYWTDEELEYNGGGPNNCYVTPVGGGGYYCGAATPMRVCAPNQQDSWGNWCNWYNCGYGATSPVEYFGGCSTNTTAGTLCCQ